MTIRTATFDDWESLAPLMEAFNAMEGIAWKADAMAEAFRRLCEEASLGFALVAEDAQVTETRNPSGYVIATYNFDLEFAGRDAFVTELFVVPEARRRGVATALLEAAEGEAIRQDVRALHLLVLPNNRVAEALYRRMGFVASPRTMMTKALTTSLPRDR